MMISTIVLAITGVFGGGGGGTAGPPSKDKVWLDRLADALNGLAGKAAEKFSDIVVSVFSAILSFLGKVVGSVTEHARALIIFVPGLISIWLMQRAEKS